ncbi:MAG TPA: D-2-hydroxyacid dehydrogenase [Roseiflexaceae bacterium]|nr:D-2-hydroxyacid dehydrogenase [Roseiflexaceae bacterium]
MSRDHPCNLLIASYLEPQYVERIRAVSPLLDVVYAPDLLAPTRYPSDHHGGRFERTPAQEQRWCELLRRAEVLFDFDYTHPHELPDLAPHVRWIQASFAGIGQYVRQMEYDSRMPQTIFTTASGMHARPLAEFCSMVMLMHTRGLLRLQQQQREQRWERYAGTDLEGRTLAIIGVGKIGVEVARQAQALGLTVIGIKRSVEQDPSSLNLHELYPPERLHDVLRRADYLVLVAPHTRETERLIGAAELACMPYGAVLINIGRGALIDEAALVAALHSGQIGMAAPDVFDSEPLPPDNPLWGMPNVIISPHSASTSDRENSRLTDLFCENLRRYLAGRPLMNQLDLQLLY